MHCINNTHQRHEIFVANRLNKNLDSKDASDWRYVSTSDNPSNDGTRGYTASRMNVISRGIQRPLFLSHNEHLWAAQPTSPQHVAVSLTHQPTDHHEKPLFEITRFSNWIRLIRTIAFCFLTPDKATNRHAALTLEHITKAFRFLIKSSQKHSFRAEMKELTKKICLPANSAPSSTIMDSCDRVADLPRPLLFYAADFLSSWMPHALQSSSSYNTFTAPMDTVDSNSAVPYFNNSFGHSKPARCYDNSLDVASLAADNSRLSSRPSWLTCRKEVFLPRSTFHSVQLELIIWDHFSSKPRVAKNDTFFSSLALSPELSILNVQRI